MSGVRALLASGQVVELDESAGADAQAVVAGLTAGSLTGSAVPLDSAELRTADGRTVRYGDIDRLDPPAS